MKLYERTWFMWLMLILLAPVGIFLMWRKNKFNKVGRIILTTIFGFFFLIFSIGISSGNQQPTNKVNNELASGAMEVNGDAKNDSSNTKQGTVDTTNSEAGNSNTSNGSVSGELKVHFINVGQADSILIQQGNSAMLIDAGNNEDSEDVKNYISNQGITKLDYVVGTHPHEDHIGGLDYIINSFEVGKIYMPKVTNTTKTFKDVVSAIQNKGMQVTTPVSGDSFKLGEADCKILAPNSSSYEDLNNYSIIIKISFGNNSFIFDGDAEAISEMEMLNKGIDVKADVLKVGHHGSTSSTCDEFLKAVNPKYAVISVGNDNKYGHPHEGTMNRLKSNNIPVYRTDECGTIVCSSDGNNLSFSTNVGDYSFRGKGSKAATKSNSKSTADITQSNNKSIADTTKKADNAQIITSESQDNPIVHIVGNGKKYHSGGCKHLHGEGKDIPLKDAAKQGYTPCKTCNPPSLK